MTTAQHAGHALADLGIRRLWVRIQECFGCHDDAVDAKSALHGLLVDERFLNRMGLLDRSESLVRGDFRSRYGSQGRDTRANRLTLYNHRALPALTEPPPEHRSANCHIVAAPRQQRRLG